MNPKDWNVYSFAETHTVEEAAFGTFVIRRGENESAEEFVEKMYRILERLQSEFEGLVVGQLHSNQPAEVHTDTNSNHLN